MFCTAAQSAQYQGCRIHHHSIFWVDLLKYCLSVLASTRALYEKKLRQLLQSARHDHLNGAEKGVLYSDSEEEEEEGITRNALDLFVQMFCFYSWHQIIICFVLLSVICTGSEGAKEETIEQSDTAQQESSQVRKLQVKLFGVYLHIISSIV